MKTRRITLGLGAAAGGLLAATYLPMTVANASPLTDLFGLFGSDATAPVTTAGTGADVFGFAPITGSPETVLTVSGLPPLDQQVEGYQTFDFFSPTTATDPLGTVNADVSTLTTPIGFTNTEYLVTGSDALAQQRAEEALTGVTATAHLPTAGSTYDIASFHGFENIYSSVAPEAATEPAKYAADSTTGVGGLVSDLMGDGTAPSAAGDVVTDTFVTPFGSFDLTPLIGGFDASSGLAGDPFASLLNLGDFFNVPDLDGTSLLGVFDLANLGDLLSSFSF
ncbi:MAG: hypothetical protein WA317_16325 [Mycobacterium sp.]|uniref:hypothetical protein n=1 Tax=Mycobacterium sp. TaxID=1785 RepID=UPI003CC5CE65